MTVQYTTLTTWDHAVTLAQTVTNEMQSDAGWPTLQYTVSKTERSCNCDIFETTCNMLQ